MKLGRPRYRKTKSKRLLWGLVRLTGTFSKSKGREAKVTESAKLGPWSRSTTGREQLTFFGLTIPIRRSRGR